MSDRLLLTPEEVAQQLSIGRTLCFELMASGELPSVKIGRARRVAVEDLAAYVQRLRDTPVNPA